MCGESSAPVARCVTHSGARPYRFTSLRRRRRRRRRQDAASVPPELCPESWGRREEWLAAVRAQRRAERAAPAPAARGAGAGADGEGVGASSWCALM